MFFTKEKVAVIQMMPGKIVLLTKDGQPGGDYPIPQAPDGGFQMIQGGESRGGNVVLYMARQKFDQAAGKWSRQSFLASIDPTGKQVAEYSSKENTINMASAEMNDATWDTFERRWEVGPNGKVCACNSYDNYDVTVYDKSGKAEKTITRAVLARARARPTKDLHEPDVLALGQDDSQLQGGHQSHGQGYREHLRPRRRLDVGALERGCAQPAQGTLGTFDVFNPEGQFVKQVTLQGRVTRRRTFMYSRRIACTW